MEKDIKIKKINILEMKDVRPLKKKLIVEIETEDTDIEYAWYIYKNNKRIETKWYTSEQRKIKVQLEGEGEYHFRGYIRNNKGRKHSLKSEKVIIGPTKIALDSLPKRRLTLEEFKKTGFTEEDPTIYTIQINGLQYDFIYKKSKESPYLTVMGAGASKIKPPVFNRFSWMNDIEGNILYYSDPTLHLGKIRVAYGIGTPQEHALQRIAEIVKIVAKKNEIRNKNILFYGSSAGGFMSLVLAGYVKDSSVFINNPVTVASRSVYFKSLSKILVEKTEEFNSYESEDIKNVFKVRTDIREFYKQAKYIPNIYYLQNAACKYDMKARLLPFVQYYHELSKKNPENQLVIDLYWDEEAQHNPVSKLETLKYIDKVRAMWCE